MTGKGEEKSEYSLLSQENSVKLFWAGIRNSCFNSPKRGGTRISTTKEGKKSKKRKKRKLQNTTVKYNIFLIKGPITTSLADTDQVLDKSPEVSAYMANDMLG